MSLYTGCVENRKDPLKLGRCQVRIVGVHTHDKTVLPTEDLPWAYPMQSITSAAISGIGSSPIGVVEGTWVVVMFRDDDHQQPIIIGSIGGIPQVESKNIDEDEDDVISINSVGAKVESTPSGDVLVSGSGSVVTDSNGNPIKTGTGSSTDPVPNQIVTPTVPSRTGKPPPASAKPGIDALNAAMTAGGITGKYGRAAILGIAGGESGWIPQSEGYNYSAEALVSVFSKTFANKPDITAKYARWKGTREAFFDYVYAPENNGSKLGNSEAGDGAKYYGRGFIQITGRYNYSRYATLSNVDIFNLPDLLNTDLAASAAVTVAYFKDKVKVDSADPAYFKAALTAVGGYQASWPKKEAYYQYFLGDAPPTEQTDKSTKKGDEAQGIPTSSNGLPTDRQKNLVHGFSDPNMKYPLRQYIGEPDTNRLARGKIEGTIVEYKDEKRLENIVTGGGFEWEQPDIPYNAKYPYNKVMETESGHIMEFDDTPENERVHLYHRKGTYTEIDPNGTQVNRIVGDGYYIMERNGYVFVGGDCNLTVNGNVRILVQADAYIDVTGDTKINMAGDAQFNVASNMSINVGGEFSLKADNIKLESNSNFNVVSYGDNMLTSSGGFHANASGEARLEGSTVHFAEGAASAEATTLGAPISKGEKSTQSFAQLIPPPRDLETELGYETPEENTQPGASTYHADRATATTSDKATTIESTPQPPNDTQSVGADCSMIYGMSSFPDSYVLHTDKTGYKWTIAKLARDNAITAGNFGNKNYTVQEIVCNMKALCINILGPLNEQIGEVGKAWFITSCYRSYVPAGGSSTSQHLIGSAVDISIGGNFGYKINYDWSVKLAASLAFDQMLLEYRDPGINGNKNPKRINWIHISYNNYGPGRKNVLTFLNDKTYSQGLNYLGT